MLSASGLYDLYCFRFSKIEELGKDREGSGSDLIEVLSRNLPNGTEENYEKPQSG
jgi:hypothetical protein